MLAVDPISNKLRKASDIQFADAVFEAKSKGQVWKVVDLIVDHWRKSNPSNFRSFIVEVKHKRDTRATKYGSNKSMNLRAIVDIPEDVIYRIRKVYTSEELPLDKEFFNEMYKRYPVWRVAEKL